MRCILFVIVARNIGNNDNFACPQFANVRFFEATPSGVHGLHGVVCCASLVAVLLGASKTVTGHER